VERVDGTGAEGRTAGQAPEVDGTTTLIGTGVHEGDLTRAVVIGSEGVDLVAQLLEVLVPARRPLAARA
jgi:ribosomal protein S12 methylthiotransferase